MKDLDMGIITLVSREAAGLPGLIFSYATSLSPDGSVACYDSGAPHLVPGATRVNDLDAYCVSLP